MEGWNSVTVSTSPSKTLASKTLRDNYGQPLIGEHIIVFQEMYIRLKKDHVRPILCSLNCNIATHFDNNQNGTLTKCHSPLKLIELKGNQDQSQIFQLDKFEHLVKNQSEITLWVTDVKGGKRIDVDLYVRLSHRRK